MSAAELRLSRETDCNKHLRDFEKSTTSSLKSMREDLCFILLIFVV